MINTRSDIDLETIKDLVNKGVFLDKEIVANLISEATEERLFKVLNIYRNPNAIDEDDELIKLVNEFYAMKIKDINKLKKLGNRLNAHLIMLSTSIKSDRACYWMPAIMLLHFLLATCQLKLGRYEEAQRNYHESYRISVGTNDDKIKLFSFSGVIYSYLSTDITVMVLMKADNFRKSYQKTLDNYVKSNTVPEVLTVLDNMLEKKINACSKNNKGKVQAEFEIQQLYQQYSEFKSIMTKPGTKPAEILGQMTEKIVKSKYFYFIDLVDIESIQQFFNVLIIYKLSECSKVKKHKQEVIQQEIADYILAVSIHTSSLAPVIAQVLQSIFHHKQTIFYSYLKKALEKIKSTEFNNTVYGGKDIQYFISQTLPEHHKRVIERNIETDAFIKEALVLVKLDLMKIYHSISNDEIKNDCKQLIDQFLDNVPEYYPSLYNNCVSLIHSFSKVNTFSNLMKHKPYLDILFYMASFIKVAMTKPGKFDEIPFLNDSLYLPTKELEDHLRLLRGFLRTMSGSIRRAKHDLDKIPHGSPCAKLKMMIYGAITKFAEKQSTINIEKNADTEQILVDLKKSIFTGKYSETILKQKMFEALDQFKIYYLQDLEYSHLMLISYLILRTKLNPEDKIHATETIMVHLAEVATLSPELTNSYFKISEAISEFYSSDNTMDKSVLEAFDKDLELLNQFNEQTSSILFKKYSSERTAPILAAPLESDNQKISDLDENNNTLMNDSCVAEEKPINEEKTQNEKVENMNEENVISVSEEETSNSERLVKNAIADKENEIRNEKDKLIAIEKILENYDITFNKKAETIKDMEIKISTKEGELSKRDAEFRKRDEKILETGMRIRQLKDEIQDEIRKQKEIERIQRAIVNKDNEIRKEQIKLQAIEKKLNNFEITFNKKSETIKIVESKISTKEAELSKKENEFRKRDEKILENGMLIRQLDGEIAEQNEIERIQTAIADKENEILNANEELKSIEIQLQNVQSIFNKKGEDIKTMDTNISAQEEEYNNKLVAFANIEGEIAKHEAQIKANEKLLLSHQFFNRFFSNKANLNVLREVITLASRNGQRPIIKGSLVMALYYFLKGDEASIALANKISERLTDIDFSIDCTIINAHDFKQLRSTLKKKLGFKEIQAGASYVNLHWELMGGLTFDLTLKRLNEYTTNPIPSTYGQAYVDLSDEEFPIFKIIEGDDAYQRSLFKLFETACDTNMMNIFPPAPGMKNVLTRIIKWLTYYNDIIKINNLNDEMFHNIRDYFHNIYVSEVPRIQLAIYLELGSLVKNNMLYVDNVEVNKILVAVFQVFFNDEGPTHSNNIDIAKFIGLFIDCKEHFYLENKEFFKTQIDSMVNLYSQGKDPTAIKEQVVNLNKIYSQPVLPVPVNDGVPQFISHYSYPNPTMFVLPTTYESDLQRKTSSAPLVTSEINDQGLSVTQPVPVDNLSSNNTDMLSNYREIQSRGRRNIRGRRGRNGGRNCPTFQDETGPRKKNQ